MACGADDDENIRNSTAKCAGSLSICLDSAQTSDILITFLDSSRSPGNTSSVAGVVNTNRIPLATVAGALLCTSAICHTAGQKAVEVREEVFALIRGAINDERIPIRVAAYG